MKRIGFLTILFAMSVILPSMVWAGQPDDPCAGDCNDDSHVTIDESVMAVNIGLSIESAAACPNLDLDGNGVAIDDLVESTGSLITDCGRNPVGDGYCGDGKVDPSLGEECDDGGICIGSENQLAACTETSDCPGPDGKCSPVGADGCAINCTPERLRKTNLSTAAGAVVQQATFPVTLALRGMDPNFPFSFQGFTTGKALDVAVNGPQGEVLTRPGDYPVAIKPNDVFFQPVKVTGLVCACVRQVAVPTFGPNNSAVGVIACGPDGIAQTSYKLVQDHVTNPGHPANGNATPVLGPQLPNDPECDDTFVFPGSGVASDACLEGTDALCRNPNERGQHPGACGSPRNITFFAQEGTVPGPGDALINNSTAIGLLNDGGLCRTDLSPGDPDCAVRFADYGPDCTPCTGDDKDLGDAENLPTTTGLASAAVYDATLRAGKTMDSIPPDAAVPCATTADCQSSQRCQRQCVASGFACPNGDCGANDTCGDPGCTWNGCGPENSFTRCISRAQGRRFDCAALAADVGEDNGDGDGMSGAALAVTFPSLDALRLGDDITSTVLDLE